MNLTHLTQGERRVLDRIVLGESDKEAARALGCGVKTVKQHVRQIFEKVGIHSRTKLIATYYLEEAYLEGVIALRAAGDRAAPVSEKLA